MRRDAAREDAQHEDRGDRRCEQRLHQLQIGIELTFAEVLQEGNPRHAKQDHHCGREAADEHEMSLARLRAQALVEVDGEQRCRRVEQRSERAHQRRQHAREHQPAQSDRQQVGDQHRESALRICADRLEARCALLEQRDGNHAGQQEDEDRGQFQISGEHRAAARFAQSPWRSTRAARCIDPYTSTIGR